MFVVRQADHYIYFCPHCGISMQYDYSRPNPGPNRADVNGNIVECVYCENCETKFDIVNTPAKIDIYEKE